MNIYNQWLEIKRLSSFAGVEFRVGNAIFIHPTNGGFDKKYKDGTTINFRGWTNSDKNIRDLTCATNLSL
jgi:hypothetical protein